MNLTYSDDRQSQVPIPYPVTLNAADSLWLFITSRNLLLFMVRSGPSEDHPLFLRPNADAIVTAPPLTPNIEKKNNSNSPQSQPYHSSYTNNATTLRR